MSETIEVGAPVTIRRIPMRTISEDHGSLLKGDVQYRFVILMASLK